MFMPCIGYYNCSLAGLPASTLAPFPLVQISAAKLILDWSWTISHRLCATKTSLATIHIMFKVATVMHSIFLCSPLYLSKLFAYCIDESRWHCLQSLSTRSIIVCWRRTQFGRCSFSVLGWMSEMGLSPEQITYWWALKTYLFMVALCNRADHYIFILFLLLLLFLFPRLISAVGDWMFAILRHMVWP